MFGLRKKGPTQPFRHTDDCKILKVTPDVEIPWSEVETGVWQAVCQCGAQWAYDGLAERRTRLDPLDPSTSRHAPQCEHRETTDPALLRIILKVQDGLGGGAGWSEYWWVTCGACQTSWQVLHYAAESVG